MKNEVVIHSIDGLMCTRLMSDRVLFVEVNGERIYNTSCPKIYELLSDTGREQLKEAVKCE